MPSAEGILEQQGVPEDAAAGDQLLSLAKQGLAELDLNIRARGLFAPISLDSFPAVYEGAGLNDRPTPLEGIIPSAEALFLFAVTCGTEVSRRIAELFAANDYPVAMALDSAASLAADKAASLVQEKVSAAFTAETGKSNAAALRYSPGYCGWHVSGQGALFAALRTQEIDLSLTESFLMNPLKSISGVIVLGPPEIHRFKPDFSFCTACLDKQCRDRIASLELGTERDG